MKFPCLSIPLCVLTLGTMVELAAGNTKKDKQERRDQIRQIESRVRQNQARVRELGLQYVQVQGQLANARDLEEGQRDALTRAAQALKTDDDFDTGDSDPELAQLQSAAREAQAKFNVVAAPVLKTLRDQPTYQHALRQLDEAERGIQRASIHSRATRDASAAGVASRHLVEAKESIRVMEQQALAEDEAAAQANADLEQAREAVVAYRVRQLETGANQHTDDRIAQLRKEYFEAHKAVREATRRRFELEAEARRVRKEGNDLEKAIVADQSWVASLRNQN
jgi:hypothetical protein